jgi:lambda family phage portal protein
MRVGWFERALGAVAPRAALRRVRACAQLDLALRAYEAAARGRHTEGWIAPGTSADAEIAAAGPVLRDRSRDLGRNNAHAARGRSAWVTNLVGSGITPRPDTGDDARDRKVKAAFERWCDECDADGQLDFYGLQTLAVTEMVEAGEVLARRRLRRAEDGLHVPLQVQILESDHLDSSVTGDRPNGNLANQGIEFDSIGRRVAYWLFAQHPGNNVVTLSMRLRSAPVPADQIAHLYKKDRTQARGVPWCAPVMRTLRDLGDYEFAEIVRKKSEACNVGVVLGSDENEGATGNLTMTDSAGRPAESFVPGMFFYAKNGKDIRFNTPSAAGGYGEYKKSALRTAAAGYGPGLPYELLSGDLADVNFSSIRTGLVEFRRSVDTLQWQVIIPSFCDPLWRWFCEAAWLAGRIDSPDIPVVWSPPKFEWVDPYKDIIAQILAIRAGILTWQQVVAATGRNPADVLAEIKAWMRLLDEDDIVLDCDPRKTTGSGVLQKLAEAVAGEGGAAAKMN